MTGVLQANIRVTGSGYDPHIEGAVDIRGGAFAIPDLGTRYTGLDTRVDLNSEGLSIQEFKILDASRLPDDDRRHARAARQVRRSGRRQASPRRSSKCSTTSSPT